MLAHVVTVHLRDGGIGACAQYQQQQQ